MWELVQFMDLLRPGLIFHQLKGHQRCHLITSVHIYAHLYCVTDESVPMLERTGTVATVTKLINNKLFIFYISMLLGNGIQF